MTGRKERKTKKKKACKKREKDRIISEGVRRKKKNIARVSLVYNNIMIG